MNEDTTCPRCGDSDGKIVMHGCVSLPSDPKPGKVALCSKKVLGVIHGLKMLPWGESWVGEKLDNDGNLTGEQWASRNPLVVAQSVEEYKELRKWQDPNWNTSDLCCQTLSPGAPNVESPYSSRAAQG